MKKKCLVFQIVIFFVSATSIAQVVDANYLDKVTLQTESSGFSTTKDTVRYQGRSCLYFQYGKDNEVCDVRIYPSVKHIIKSISLVESADFRLLDSLVNYNNQYYTFKVQFQHLSASSFLRFRLNLDLDSGKVMQDIPLLPVTATTVDLAVKGDELTVGEEKVFELITNHPENIRFAPNWQTQQDVEYRISESHGQLFLHLLANTVGQKSLSIHLQTYSPFFANGSLSSDLPALNPVFNVKKAALTFLQTDKNDFVFDDKLKNEGVEIQIDNARNLQLNNTYLVEGKESPGSPLIAEIFTKERLSNNKVLCVLRAFNYHRKSDGCLYIKDNDVARFITNFNVIPSVSIEHIKIMRNGKDWKEDATIYPGETVNLRLEGQSLEKSQLRFDGLVNLRADSVVKNDKALEYRLKVPVDISKKSIEIYNEGEKTGQSLTVKECSKAHPFDYITINYGNGSRRLSDIHGPELYDKLIKDVIISFQPNKIDSATNLYGKQYLTL